MSRLGPWCRLARQPNISWSWKVGISCRRAHKKISFLRSSVVWSVCIRDGCPPRRSRGSQLEFTIQLLISSIYRVRSRSVVIASCGGQNEKSKQDEHATTTTCARTKARGQNFAVRVRMGGIRLRSEGRTCDVGAELLKRHAHLLSTNRVLWRSPVLAKCGKLWLQNRRGESKEMDAASTGCSALEFESH